jgi:hypothetical protein
VAARQPETRQFLISAALDFVRNVSQMTGVERVALIGSICTIKPGPKDVDVLVTIKPPINMERLARLGRRLKGKTQTINCGADIFLADPDGQYLGRTCRWKICQPEKRMSCKALNCGRVQYLYDDLQQIELGRYLITNPPIVIYPEIIVCDRIPDDLMKEVKLYFKSSVGPHRTKFDALLYKGSHQNKKAPFI